jgi:hypothetical protein
MPALTSRLRRLPGPGARVVTGGLVAALVVTVVLGSPEPAAARDWSPYIASLRNSQLAYESAMRAADIQIRSLGRAMKQTRRSVSRARHMVARKRDRLERRRERSREARLAWLMAQAELRAASVVPPTVQGLSTVLRSAAFLAPLPTLVEGPDPGSDPGTGADPVTSGSEELASEAHDFIEGVLAARAKVATLAREVRRQERNVERARARVVRAGRNQRLRIRHLGALRRARNAAIARREGAEAGLGNAILGM